MLLSKDTSSKLTVFLLVSLFICADLMQPQTQDGWQVLDNNPTVSRAVSNHYVLSDTYINESSPTTNYNSSDTGFLIPTDGDETRILLDFPMNFTSSDIIYNASVELTCTIISGQMTSDISVYPARMNQGWNTTHVSWNYYGQNLLWTGAGVNDAADRFDWEPPTIETQTGVFSINVTSLAQQAAKSNLGRLRIVLAATGSSYSCDLSETANTNNQPVLVVDSSSGTPTSGGDVEFNLPIDEGAPWMKSDFILTAETLPTIAYKNHTANHVELHLSHSSDWKMASWSQPNGIILLFGTRSKHQAPVVRSPYHLVMNLTMVQMSMLVFVQLIPICRQVLGKKQVSFYLRILSQTTAMVLQQF